MANIFLDVNILVNVIQQGVSYDTGQKQSYYISALTIHILMYLSRNRRNELVESLARKLHIVDYTEDIVLKGFTGPTQDYEDNVQLHSAIKGICDLFYTKDKELLKLGYFGSMKIEDPTVLF